MWCFSFYSYARFLILVWAFLCICITIWIVILPTKIHLIHLVTWHFAQVKVHLKRRNNRCICSLDVNQVFLLDIWSSLIRTLLNLPFQKIKSYFHSTTLAFIIVGDNLFSSALSDICHCLYNATVSSCLFLLDR